MRFVRIKTAALDANDGELSEEDLEQIAGGWSRKGFWTGMAIAVVATAAAAAGGGIGGLVGDYV